MASKTNAIYHSGGEMSTPSRPFVSQRFLDGLYGRIARRYDLLNVIQSFGLDRGIRRAAARRLGRGVVLDAGAGTGDLAAACLAGGARRVVCLDRSPEMTALAREKLEREAREGRVYFVRGDIARLPFQAGVFDGVGSAFVYRNVPDVACGLGEARRVLAAGGRLVVVDVFAPPGGWWGRLYKFYLKFALPVWGRVIARDIPAYKYLAASIKRCFAAAEFEAFAKDAGFGDVQGERRWGGIAAVVSGRREVA